MSANSMLAMYKLTDAEWRAGTSDRLAQSKYAAYLDFVLRHVAAPAAGFDFGCGHGVLMNRLRERGFAMAGCDISDELVDPADPEMFLGGVEVLAGASRQFDFVLAVMVLQLLALSERTAFYAAARDRVRPGGTLFIVNGNARTNVARKAANLPDPDTYAAVLVDYGFEQCALGYTKCLPGLVARGAARLLGRTPKLVFDAHQVARIPEAALKRRCAALMFAFRKS